MPDVVPSLVFTATFLALAGRRIGRLPLPRGPVALLGGLLMVVTGTLAPRAALAAVDLGTLALLVGMMLLAGALAAGGLFMGAAAWITRHVRSERQLVLATLWSSAVLSALFLNDTVALFLPPVLFAVTRGAGIPSFRTTAACAIGVNVGSLWTPIGNPQNAYLATRHDIGFLDFAVHMTPLVLFGLLVASLVLAWKATHTPLVHTTTEVAPPHRPTLVVALAATTLTLALFVFAAPRGVPLWTAAAATGALVLVVVPLVGPHRTQDVLRRVDANLLLLFVGLFLLVGGARSSGITTWAFSLLPLAAADATREIAQVTLVTFVGSNLFSNVPTVLFLDLAVAGLGDPLYPQLLAAASTLSGNTTLLASAATLIVAEQAEAHGERFPFWRFTRIGLIVTAATLAATVPYFVWLRA